MTPEQISELVRHLGDGVTVTFSITVSESIPHPTAPPEVVSAPPPDDALQKVAACAAVVRLPERELRRAAQAGFLPHEIKTTGRDAGAVMLRIVDVRAYSERRERVKRGEDPAPEGWTGPQSVYG